MKVDAFLKMEYIYPCTISIYNTKVIFG